MIKGMKYLDANSLSYVQQTYKTFHFCWKL